MNSPLKLAFRSALALGAALAFTSCETYPAGYGDAPIADPGGYAGGGGYYSGGGGYASRPYYGSGYGGGYYSSDYYRRNGGRYDRNDNYYRGNDHRYDHDNDHRNDRNNDHRNDRGNDNRKSGSDNDIRLTKYREGGKPSDLPSGYHSKDWYQQRGYSLSKNNYQSRDGDPRGHANDSKKGKDNDHDSKNDKKR